MNTTLAKILGVLVLMSGALFSQIKVNEPVDLLPEGNFTGSIGGYPRGWDVPHPNYLADRNMAIQLVAPAADDKGNIVRFVNDSDPVTAATMKSTVMIKPEWIGRFIRVEMDMRSERLVPGTEDWHNARLIVSYVRADGRQSYSPGALFLDYDQNDFVPKSLVWKIEPDAKALNLGLGLFNCKGVLEVRNLKITLE